MHKNRGSQFPNVTLSAMALLFLLFQLTHSTPTYAQEDADRPYSDLSQGELYRAINWIRDVSNPRHTAPPNAWTQEGRVGDTLFIDGEVQEIQWSMLKHGEYRGVKRVVLNSYGGLVAGALELATVIREQQLDTVVPAGGVCMSACTLLFQAGVRRQAHRSALFLYHAPRSGRIGMSALESQCKAQGPVYCDRRQQELIDEAPQVSQNFFQTYLQFDMAESFIDLMMNLPKDITDYWKVTGNWFQTVDLIYTNNPNHPFLKSREAPFILEPLSNMEPLNIVTDWFDYDPGWRVDRSVQPDANHFVNP